MFIIRRALLTEIVGMAFDTLRVNKLRSGLTIMGVIIGITAIVGMTSLVRGFDRSLRAMIEELGPNTVFIAKFSGMSFMSGKEFIDLIRNVRRPLPLLDVPPCAWCWLCHLGRRSRRRLADNGGRARRRALQKLGSRHEKFLWSLRQHDVLQR